MTGKVTHTLPTNWARFVEQVTLGAAPGEAAKAMGWESPQQVATSLMRHPEVRKALAAASLARLEGVSLPLALDTVDEILRDKDAPKAVRAKLALGIVDRLIKKEGADAAAAGGTKDLNAMTVRELEQLLAQSGVRAGQMLDITPRDTAPGDDEP
jgi:hypothetical protein